MKTLENFGIKQDCKILPKAVPRKKNCEQKKLQEYRRRY